MEHGEGIRKAAILVAALDRQSADALLEKIDAARAQLVRRSVLQLGEIDPDEERNVIDEFFRAGAQARAATDVDLDGHFAGRLARAAASPPRGSDSLEASEEQPFRFLQEAETDKLARLLTAERPQTVALVLSHLPPQRAGAVLVRLQPPLQVDVIRRLVDLEETDPEILHEVERTLETRLSELVGMQRRRVAGLSAVAEILAASDQQVGMQILDSLNAYDRRLAERLQPDGIHFDDLGRLDDRSLELILTGADPEVAILALVGAPQDLSDRLLGLLPEPEARVVRRRLVHIGPTRLSDVEQARSELVELARRLAAQGRIRLPKPSDPIRTATAAAACRAAA